MNLIDIFLLIPLLLGLYRGYAKGIIRQITGLVGVIAAIFISLIYSSEIVKYILPKGFISEQWTPIVGFILCFFVVLIAVNIIGAIISKATKTIGLGFIERIAGALLGGLKMFLFTMAILFLFEKINSFGDFMPQDKLDNSIVYGYYKLGFNILENFWTNHISDL